MDTNGNPDGYQYVWDLAGMDRVDYSRLPWTEQKKLLIRHKGIGIQEICETHGMRMFVCWDRERIAAMPAELRNHPMGRLIWAYRKSEAERKTIEGNYPQTKGAL